MELSEFWTLCSSNGIVLDQNQLKQFTRFAKEILIWNEKVNLISRKDEENLVERHILHSLSILKYVELPLKARCLDLGTGGGFPGIPIAIANPEARMMLIDSISKKLKIADMLAKHTGHRYIKAKCIRAEGLAEMREFRKNFDFVFTRGVAQIAKVYGWTAKLLKDNGKLVLLKGGNLDTELEEAAKLYPELRFEVKDIKMIGVEWFEKEEKKIVICSRKANTSSKLNRKRPI